MIVISTPSAYVLYHLKKCPDSVAIQLMLAHLQLPYKDEAIRKEDWPLVREEILTKRVPALRIERPNGELTWINESKGIVRCIGAAYDLLGKDEMEKYYVDRMIGKIMETVKPLGLFYLRKRTTTDLEEAKKKLFEDLTPLLKMIDKMLEEVPGACAASTNITIADFYLLPFVDFLLANKPDCLQPYPEMMAWRKHLLEVDQGVAKFVAGQTLTIV
ncbi:unnamed protein product [Schistocephalus solidus]|uniref:Glutathione transferase n=1 Tax=Schistocephalus solidus TaxID=70667 RepID=A0A183SLZ8_SCHSO|nr:unnamed protein product [Schistocephalus solidus]